MKKFAGLDVHCKTTSFCVATEDGAVVAQGSFETTRAALHEWAGAQQLAAGTRVALESGTMATFVAGLLQEIGLEPVIIDAEEVRIKARRRTQKTDTRDAFELCDGVRRDIYVRIVNFPAPETRRLRQLLIERRHFVKLAAAEVSSLKSAFRREGLVRVCRSVQGESSFTRLEAHSEVPESLKRRVARHRELWVAARKQVKAINGEIETARANRADDIERLTAIRGIGPVVATTTVAYLNSPERFHSAKHAASYAGVVPQMSSSGGKERFGHITHRGPKELRAMLVESAHFACRPDHPFHALYRRVARKKGHKIATVAVANKLARVMWAMLKNKTQFDPTRHAAPRQRGAAAA